MTLWSRHRCTINNEPNFFNIEVLCHCLIIKMKNNYSNQKIWCSYKKPTFHNTSLIISVYLQLNCFTWHSVFYINATRENKSTEAPTQTMWLSEITYRPILINSRIIEFEYISIYSFENYLKTLFFGITQLISHFTMLYSTSKVCEETNAEQKFI